MSRMFRQPTGRERWIAIAIELLPLPATLIYFALPGRDVPPWSAIAIVPVFYLGILATGVGWTILGRWDVGCGFAVVRVVGTVAVGVVAFMIADPCLYDCSGDDEPGLVLTVILDTVVGLTYLAPTLGSPLRLIWALRRESQMQDGGV